MNFKQKIVYIALGCLLLFSNSCLATASWFGPSGFWREDLAGSHKPLFGKVGIYIGGILLMIWIIFWIYLFMDWIKDRVRERRNKKS